VRGGECVRGGEPERSDRGGGEEIVLGEESYCEGRRVREGTGTRARYHSLFLAPRRAARPSSPQAVSWQAVSCHLLRRAQSPVEPPLTPRSVTRGSLGLELPGVVNHNQHGRPCPCHS
jgi:hypothetical protein